MQEARKKAILQTIEKDMQDIGYHTTMDTQDGSTTLSFLMPLFEDGGNVFIEIFIKDLAEEFSSLQFFTTMIAEIGPGMEALASAIASWNLSCAVGAYGIYEPSKQMYHRYCALLDADEEPLNAGITAQRVLYTMFEELGDKLDTARLLASGDMSLEQAKAQKLC